MTLAVPIEAEMTFGQPLGHHTPVSRGNIHSFLGGSDGMNCGHESLHHAKVVMDDLGQQGQGKQAVGTGGTADNLEEVVIILMVHPHHKHEGISKRQR